MTAATDGRFQLFQGETGMEIKQFKPRYIYCFGKAQADGDGSMREELGGKGAALAEMTKMGLPVPPGFTISCDACRYYLKHGELPESLDSELEGALGWLELVQAQQFGSEIDPLLLSVRSGAAVSMPGMMDTILNVGISDANVAGLAAKHTNVEFALDSYRRLLQMFGSVVLEIPKQAFDRAVEDARELQKPTAALDEMTLRKLIAAFQRVIEQNSGRPFPMDPRAQLRQAVEAVFQSWNNERARHYRRIHGTPENAGTAVTVQAMVFGNYGLNSGTGVGFTRNPSTGEKKMFAEFLSNAQGEDIVAGIRTPMPIAELERTMSPVYQTLYSVTSKLEDHYRDVQDFEFTVQNGELFLLQTRSAKRSALARLRCAVEMAEEGLISRGEALERVAPADIDEVLAQQLDLSDESLKPIAKGLAASPGSAVGQLALTADRAVDLAGKHKQWPIILVRQETTADDIHGMDAAVGFLTAHGGATSHAAVVARGMGKCCITGASGIFADEGAGVLRIGEHILKEGDWLSLDGSTGRVFLGQLPLRGSESFDNSHLTKLLSWARECSITRVRANADTPQDATRSRAANAVGIGLCRTEHMFFAKDRLAHIRSMILASTLAAREDALALLLPMQQSDFEALFHAMAGLPVTIRLIDPPLHEFLPSEITVREELAQARLRVTGSQAVVQLEALLTRVQQLGESNPMLGLRGCRLGIVYPEILVMQIKAILQAALRVKGEGADVLPEIMVPLIACVEEVRHLRKLIEDTASVVFQEQGRKIDYRVGVMIELPRAAVCAAEIAHEVDFMSFGTNDLTQLTFGFSRDDAHKYLDTYLELGILKNNPFLTIDRDGVGALIEMAVGKARAANPKIKIGICGEHGGDPGSIAFFESVGVDYVSCSPARIPIAQLSAARTSLARQPFEPKHHEVVTGIAISAPVITTVDEDEPFDLQSYGT
jgi:pyruvate, orthophosphate dikinase